MASMETTASPPQASAMVPAAWAPLATSASTLSRERLYAVTRCPAATRFAAMPAPMLPSPMKPMSMGQLLLQAVTTGSNRVGYCLGSAVGQ